MYYTPTPKSVSTCNQSVDYLSHRPKRGVIHHAALAVTIWCVPNQPKTPVRSIRIPDDIYELAKEKAQGEQRSLSDVVRDLLTAWVYEDDPD